MGGCNVGADCETRNGSQCVHGLVVGPQPRRPWARHAPRGCARRAAHGAPGRAGRERAAGRRAQLEHTAGRLCVRSPVCPAGSRWARPGESGCARAARASPGHLLSFRIPVAQEYDRRELAVTNHLLALGERCEKRARGQVLAGGDERLGRGTELGKTSLLGCALARFELLAFERLAGASVPELDELTREVLLARPGPRGARDRGRRWVQPIARSKPQQ